MQKGTILSIDDDPNLQEVVRSYLEDDGYTVSSADDMASALEKIDSVNFEAILLDLVLPDGEGMDLIPKFREKSAAPIIVVSGKKDTTEKIICLEMGADDYITKPFEMRELSARLKAALRRVNAGETRNPGEKSKEDNTEKIYFQGWCLDCAQYELFDYENTPAKLTTGEFKTLEALARSPNKALTRERLFELTRDEGYESYDRAIDIQIARLRKKLKNDSDLIKTVHGIGYMFTGETKIA